MIQKIKSVIRNYLPKGVIYGIWNTLVYIKSIPARRRFNKASEIPFYLDSKELATLHNKYYTKVTNFEATYKYDFDTLKKRGKDRSYQILKMLPKGGREIITTLEVGCSDGLVSYFFKKLGKKAVAIDINKDNFDKRAIKEGVKFYQIGVENLKFPDNSIDLIFSFNTFEHLPDPNKALQEIIRILKVDGYIYLSFGPLYMSSEGLHAYHSVTVPYCQHLFSQKAIENFIKKNKLKPHNFKGVNKYSLEDFRKLWNQHSNRLKKIKYYEVYDALGLQILKKYSSCFKSKSKFFNNFMVFAIELLFKKVK